MFRNYDWECQTCGRVFERVVSFAQGSKPPRLLGDSDADEQLCPHCHADATTAERLISLVAPYTGEKVLNPIVRGGQFDTAGMKTVPRPPEIGTLPDHATYAEAREFVRRPVYQEWRQEKKAVQAENRFKRKRLRALAAGAPINFKRDKCPGDPKITA